jgi:hypothetical protein
MDAYAAALINFRMIASHVFTTDEFEQSLNEIAMDSGN